MARVRTFIAIELDDDCLGRIEELRAALQARVPGEVNWVEEKNVHLTLLFLGEVPQLEIVDICQAVRKVTAKHAKFSLELRGVGGFPNLRRPKILWVGAGEGAEALIKLHDDLEEVLLELGSYRRENRAYRPHVTLGRIKSAEDAEQWGNLIGEFRDWPGGSISIKSVQVMASDLRGDRPIYSTLGSGKLK